MPRRSWSFLMPAEDHTFVKRLLVYYHSRLSVWGQILFWISFLGAAASSPGTHIAAFLLPSFIIALFLSAYCFAPFFRPQVTLKRLLPPPPSAGGICVYHVLARNTGKRVIRNLAVFESLLPYGLYSAYNHPQFNNTIDWLEPGQEKKVTLVLRTPRRGTFELGSLLAGSSFPSGLLCRPMLVAARDRFVVYPHFVTQSRLAFKQRSLFQPGGIIESSKAGDSNEFLSTREFRYGDRLRDVHWPSTARADKLIVKEYIEEYVVRVGIVLDTHWPRGTGPQDFEGRVSLAAGITDALSKRDCIIDLFTMDETIPPLSIGRSLGTIDHLLETLSCLEGDARVDLNRLFEQCRRELAQLSSVIVLLKDWDASRLELVERLRSAGAHVRVVIVRRRPTSLPVDASINVVSPKNIKELLI